MCQFATQSTEFISSKMAHILRKCLLVACAPLADVRRSAVCGYTGVQWTIDRRPHTCRRTAWRHLHFCLKLLCLAAGASERRNVSANATELVLFNLASNTRYRVSLQAVSRQGPGPAAVKYYTTRALFALLIILLLTSSSYLTTVTEAL